MAPMPMDDDAQRRRPHNATMRIVAPMRKISSVEFVEQCAAILEVGKGALASRSRLPAIVEARRIMVTLGRERWKQKTSELAVVLQKSADVISYLKREGVKRRLEDQEFASRLEDLDKRLIARLS